MKQKRSILRYNLLWTIILCYLIPLLGISIYGFLVPRESGDWNILSLGFFITACGSLALFWKMTNWENSFNIQHLNPFIPEQGSDQSPEAVLSSEKTPFISVEEHDLAKLSLAEAQQGQMRLLAEIDILSDDLKTLASSKEQMSTQTDKIQKELEQTKRAARQELEQQQHYIRELQETLAHQKSVSEKKQQQMLQLETKVGDLTSEIKTLLQFAEAIEAVAEELFPNRLCQYLFELSQKFNQFFEQCPVLQAEESERISRLSLCDITAKTLKLGLNLLGIRVLEQM